MSAPIRRGLIGLPIQRSIFRGLDGIGYVLGMTDVLPGGRLEARLDDRGDLYLDPAQTRSLSEAFLERCSPELVGHVDRILRAACAGLQDATRAILECSPTSPEDARAALDVLDERLAALAPFALMTKFVPEALSQCLERAGDLGPPPFPNPSPGRRLAAAVLDLAARCLACGYDPDRLAAEWPGVAPDVGIAVTTFCRRQTGFGPVAWEPPGYETPGVVFDAMAGALGGSSRAGPEPLLPSDDLDPGPRLLAPPGDPGSFPAAVRDALGLWLEFLDLEVWHLRRAFYLAVVPAVRILARGLDVAGEDLLFESMRSLATGSFDPRAAEGRRRRYEADVEYLGRHAIEIDRLGALMAPAPEQAQATA